MFQYVTFLLWVNTGLLWENGVTEYPSIQIFQFQESEYVGIPPRIKYNG